MIAEGNGAASDGATAEAAAPLSLPDEAEACLRALERMTEELRAALLANDVDRVREVSGRQAEWAAAVAAKLRDGSLAQGDRPEEVRQLAERVSREIAANGQLLEDGIAVTRFALGAMTGADDGGGMYGSNGMIRGHEPGSRSSAGRSSAGIVRRTV